MPCEYLTERKILEQLLSTFLCHRHWHHGEEMSANRFPCVGNRTELFLRAEFLQCEKNLEADFERLISFMCCAPTLSLGLQTSEWAPNRSGPQEIQTPGNIWSPSQEHNVLWGRLHDDPTAGQPSLEKVRHDSLLSGLFFVFFLFSALISGSYVSEPEAAGSRTAGKWGVERPSCESVQEEHKNMSTGSQLSDVKLHLDIRCSSNQATSSICKGKLQCGQKQRRSEE